MADKLIELVTKKLLEKFGAGMHKPGSGSASAFQGMLSAQLLITVIDLTNQNAKKERYKTALKELLPVREDIKSRLYPSLEKLFQDDSDLFDRVIILRRERDAINRDKDPLSYGQKVMAENQALRGATDIPLQIGKLCNELGKYAGMVFDLGFHSARGDSGVALQCAISGMGSCLSIMELNLTKLPADKWMEDIRKEKKLLKSYYTTLLKLGEDKLNKLEKNADQNWEFQRVFAKYRLGTLGKTIQSNHDMENLVREFQNDLWLQQDMIWKKEPFSNPMYVINPKDILQRVLGYTFTVSNSLGFHTIGTDVFEVAGLIDKNQKWVSVSNKFSDEIKNFTAAHELGHLILHKQPVLHRDRPIDGFSNTPKDPLEQQADKFAAYFLMPASIVKKVFQEIFEVEKLYLDEEVVLALAAGKWTDVRAQIRNQLGFALVIAQIEIYRQKQFNSMAKIFKVSPGAMAIRLIELSLVEF